MKKIWIVCLVLLLIGCHRTPAKVVKVEPEEEIEVKEEIEEVEYIESDVLKELVLLANMKTEIIDIAYLHDRLSKALLEQVDLSLSIDHQSDLIEAIIQEELYDWKVEMVHEMLSENQVTLNEDDFDTLVARTSTRDAYQVMSVYEMVYLKREAD